MPVPSSWAHFRAISLAPVLPQSIWIPRPAWTAKDIPDLTGKVVIVTGGNTGIGKETAKSLLARNAKVYLACRSAEKAETAIADLERTTGKKAIHLSLDLSSLKSVKASAQEFMSKEKELHILINNAGVMYPPHSQVAEGYDLQFHTNVTGHWYLTKLLLPTLLETAKHSPPKSVRVVHVASLAHYFAREGGLIFGSFKDGPERQKLGRDKLYMQSKFGNIVVSNEFHRRYAEQGLVSISLNPGNINTELYRYVDRMPILGPLKKLGAGLGLYPITLGAVTQLYAATAEEAGDYGGKFLIPWARLGKARADSDDPTLGKDLWTWLEEQFMANSKKADPSALFSDSISVFTKSATKAFNEFQSQVRGDIARAEADARQARNERDEALKALQESKRETQLYKDEILEYKARLKEAELTNSHHLDNYALLQRETSQWKDQAKNWQEHFLRVEQERCSLASRMDELVTERLIIPPVTPKLPSTKSTTSMATHSAPRPPTYHSAAPASSSKDANSSRSPLPPQPSRTTGKSAKRKVPSQSELPPYTEVAQTPQTTQVTASSLSKPTNRSTRKSAAGSSRSKKVAPPPPPPATAETPKEPSEPKQIFIRRVRAVVEIKQEEESDEDLSEPPPPESPEELALTPRRSRNARRARQIVDDDEYVPEDASQLGSNYDAEDDELMIGAGDDLSFDINSSSSTRQPTSKSSPNKKRKLNTSASSKPTARRKT
ncbi:hypothetical protein NP233_g6621 [Leucocoprinus birnbaumii]|uniref:NAD(P)-binding protein n=1 Tax=Leucocoprinus birnbaumii TaxID=56174 RepID=A0AAD5YQR9_9AGAR|nr:hypothetical protein NP233_g6621 [Leucocoprinus birnbaumii]